MHSHRLRAGRWPARWPAIALYGLSTLTSATLLADDVLVPGGTAAIRQLLRLDPGRPASTFFLEVHQALVADASGHAARDTFAARRRLVQFGEDLAEWRREFGATVELSTSKEAWKRTRKALDWLGFKLTGEAHDCVVTPREGEEAVRRQALLPLMGAPVAHVRLALTEGKPITIAPADGTAPLPFGLTAWRETLDLNEDELTRDNAFLLFVKDIKASRMLVALHALDAETRDGIRTLVRDDTGRAKGWRLLFEDTLDAFTRFPEALSFRDGRFVLPGGTEGDAVWADILGVSPSDRKGFLGALYHTDGGKAAYVIDALGQLPDPTARAIVLGGARGAAAVKRFRRLYRSIERVGGNLDRRLKDPYDFAHLVRFLVLSDEGELLLPGGAPIWYAALAGGAFPRSESELAEILADARRKRHEPEEFLRRLFRSEVAGSTRRLPAQKSFLLVLSLIDGRPALVDPGVIVLLFRGMERFLPAYAALEDLPLTDPAVIRRYLFTLDRLDVKTGERGDEVKAGLFQASVEILAGLAHAGALPDERIRQLFEGLLELPVFAQRKVTVAQGLADALRWFDGDVLGALEAAENELVDGRRRERDRHEEEYRASLSARNERIRERRAGARAEREAARAAAEENVRALLAPVCLPDDAVEGPLPAGYVLDRVWLAEAIPAGASTETRQAAVLSPLDLAQIWINEAVARERERARPLPPEPEPVRVEGQVAGTTAIVDATEPLPRLVESFVPEPGGSPDEVLTVALVGRQDPALFSWRGGRYRFDPVADEASRRREFRENQRVASFAEIRAIGEHRRAVLSAASRADVSGVRGGADQLLQDLGLGSSADSSRALPANRKVAREEQEALEAAEAIRSLQQTKELSRVSERLEPLDALAAERLLEAALGHLYAAAAGDPANLYFQDPEFVRRHSFRWDEKLGASPWMATQLKTLEVGKGSYIAGALSGLPDVLGLLHVEQIVYRPGAALATESAKSGLVGPVRRISIARLDDDALRFVALSCRATEELALLLSNASESERSRSWHTLAHDLVPALRLNRLMSPVEPGQEAALVGDALSPSDLFRIGRRLALREGVAPPDPPPSLVEARNVWGSLVLRLGVGEARRRLAEFGPRPVSYAGKFRLSDIDMPPYERLAEYRVPFLFADRLYDAKVVVARRLAEARLPSALVPLVLPKALDEIVSRTQMAFPYDWGSVVRSALALSSADLDRFLDEALRSGRVARVGGAEPE